MTDGPVDAALGTAPNSTQTSPQNSPVGRVPQESPSVRARVKTWEANNPKKQIITFGRPPSSRSPSPSLEPRTVAKPPPLPVRDDVSVASGLGTPHETDDDAEWTTVRIRNRKTGEATAVRVKKGTDVRELVDRYASSKNKAGRVRVTNVTKKAVPCPTRPLERLSSKVWKEEAAPVPPAPRRRSGFLALAVVGLAAGAGAGLGRAAADEARAAAAEAKWEAAVADLEASRGARGSRRGERGVPSASRPAAPSSSARGAAARALPPKYAAVAAAPGPPRRPGRPAALAVPARRGRAAGRRRQRAAAAAEPRPRGERALIHAPLAFLNGLFAGGEEKRRPGAASRLAGIAVAAAFILAPDDGRTW
ncbi:hypothetical protein JL722_7192 [Aureococcus anophagefferens]|nr:hypothetical protein JL722_7192 [Aureococcus anophagefferens]